MKDDQMASAASVVCSELGLVVAQALGRVTIRQNPNSGGNNFYQSLQQWRFMLSSLCICRFEYKRTTEEFLTHFLSRRIALKNSTGIS